MHANAAEHKRLTQCLSDIRREIRQSCVTRWTPDQIAQAFPDGYPDDLLRKGRQSCEASIRDMMP